MAYTKEQIEEYKEILNNYEKQVNESLSPEEDNRFRCWNCKCDDFFVESGFYMCESCDSFNGHSLGYYDKKEYYRFHYRRNSIYQRKYHYENKVKDISKRISLSDDEEYCLYNKLMEIDQETITKINELFNRMKMISVFYLIKKILEEMGCEKYHQIGIKLSKESFANYEKWWEYYKSLCNPPMERAVSNSS